MSKRKYDYMKALVLRDVDGELGACCPTEAEARRILRRLVRQAVNEALNSVDAVAIGLADDIAKELVPDER